MASTLHHIQVTPLAIHLTFMSDILCGNRRTFLHDFGKIFSKCKESWGHIGCAYHDDSVVFEMMMMVFCRPQNLRNLPKVCTEVPITTVTECQLVSAAVYISLRERTTVVADSSWMSCRRSTFPPDLKYPTSPPRNSVQIMEADYEIEICREKMAFLVQKRRFWSSGLSFVGGGGSARYHRLFGGGDFHPEDRGRRIRNLDRTPLKARSWRTWPGITLLSLAWPCRTAWAE